MKKTFLATAAIGLVLSTNPGLAATVAPDTETTVSSETMGGVVFSANMSTGYLTGQAHEMVYWPHRGNHKASDLTWDIDSLYMLGIGGSVEFSRVKLNADIWFSVTDGDGYMEDLDWLDPGNDWTHRSTHNDTSVTGGAMFDTSAEMKFFTMGQVSFTAIVGFRHDSFEWEARGGSYVYSVNGFRDAQGSFPDGQLGITYEQIFNVPYAGIGFIGDFNNLHISAKLTGSTFVNGEANDQHHLRNLEINDDFSNESMWAFDVGVSYDITSTINIKAAYMYESYASMTGDALWTFNDEGVTYLLEDGAGAELETSLLSMTLSYTF